MVEEDEGGGDEDGDVEDDVDVANMGRELSELGVLHEGDAEEGSVPFIVFLLYARSIWGSYSYYRILYGWMDGWR